MSRAASSAVLSDRARFERDGYLVVPGLVRGEALGRMIAAVDRLQDAPEAPGAYMKYFEESLVEPGRRLLNRVENFVPYDATLGALLTGPEVQGLVAAVLGEPAVLFKDKINFKLPGGGAFEPHQDAQAGWDSYADYYVNVSITVDETTIENGCLEIAEWRHRRALIGRMWEPLAPAELEGIRFVPVPTRPGDAIVFDSYIPHQSAPNLSATPRRVIYATYNRAAAGDHRARYYADKRQSYPPDCEREAGKTYQYRV